MNFHNPFVQQQTEVTGQADATKHDKTGRKIQDNNTFPQKQLIVQGWESNITEELISLKVKNSRISSYIFLINIFLIFTSENPYRFSQKKLKEKIPLLFHPKYKPSSYLYIFLKYSVYQKSTLKMKPFYPSIESETLPGAN